MNHLLVVKRATAARWQPSIISRSSAIRLLFCVRFASSHQRGSVTYAVKLAVAPYLCPPPPPPPPHTHTLECSSHQSVRPSDFAGGWVGYDRRVWNVQSRSVSSVTFAMVSLDGEEGFPGEVALTVTHTLTPMGEWELRYTGRSTSTTVLAMTNHAYFNLNANVDGAATVEKHVSGPS
jgi:hypothetical protein